MKRVLRRKLLRDLSAQRGQAIAIATVLAAGVAVFVPLKSASGSLEASVVAFYARTRFPDLFAACRRAPDSVAAGLASSPLIARAEGRIATEGRLELSPGGGWVPARVQSIPARGRPALADLVIRSGRWPAPDREDEALLSEAFGRAVGLVPGAAIRVVVHGRLSTLRVVGLAVSPEFLFAMEPHSNVQDDGAYAVVWAARRPLAAALDLDGAFNDLAVSLAPNASEAAAIAEIDRALAPYGGTGALPRSLQVSNSFVRAELDQLSTLATALPPVFLGVAVFLLHVLLVRTVATQRQQIGTLEALGYGNGSLVVYYVAWSLAIATAGAAMGTAVGAVASSALTRSYAELLRLPSSGPPLPFGSALEALAVSGAVAAMGGLAAVRQVTRLSPAAAMRPEAPSTFRAGVVTRALSAPWLPLTVRAALRGLWRRPIRALASTLALALGEALVVLASFSGDSVPILIDVEYGVRQRFDASVAFDEPRPRGALHELSRLEGVLDAEPFRVVSARLRHGHRARTIAVTGLEESARLQRVHDARRDRVVSLPRDGLVLCRSLATALGVGSGGTVTLEPLEGRRVRREVRVLDVIDDYAGLNAYAELGTLNGWLEEGELYTGVTLLLDPLREAGAVAAVQTWPGVAAVSLTRKAIESAERGAGASFALIRFMLTILACLMVLMIVLGVSQVTLSERWRELSTMRVLGFTPREVGFSLASEIALLVAASVPVGLVLGSLGARAAAKAFETEAYRIPFALSRATSLQAALAVVLGGSMAAFLVARQAGRVDALAALRNRE